MIPSIFLYLDLQIIISTYASNRFANFDIEISKDDPLSVKNSHLKERKKENEISEISFPSRRYRVSQRKYRFFAFASSLRNVAIRRSQRQHGTETRSHSRSHRNHVKPMVVRSEIQVYKAFDQGPQHTSTHGRAKSGWRIQWWPRHRRLSVSSFHERV